MYFVKIPVSSEATVSVDITSNNVFTRCVQCGKEVQVDLEQIAEHCRPPLLSAGVFCSPDCCCAYHKEHDKDFVCEDDEDLDPFIPLDET